MRRCKPKLEHCLDMRRLFEILLLDQWQGHHEELQELSANYLMVTNPTPWLTQMLCYHANYFKHVIVTYTICLFDGLLANSVNISCWPS